MLESMHVASCDASWVHLCCHPYVAGLVFLVVEFTNSFQPALFSKIMCISRTSCWLCM